MVASCLIVVLVALVGCSPPGLPEARPDVVHGEAQPVVALPTNGVIAFPELRLSSEASLEEALTARRSVRSFGDEPLTLAEMGQLFWAAQGVTNPQGYRTAPSAGALYPLEVYAVAGGRLYHYLPEGHTATVQAVDGEPAALCDAALNQQAVCQAPTVFIITAVYERTAMKYGQRAERYVLLEAGHAAQNLLLQAVALDLGAVPIGAFYDDQVQAALGLPTEHQPLYLIPVGRELG
jgi:SagB-type dehydrogenase family enzyme